MSEWRESLPDEIRESETLKDIEDVGSLAQQFIEQSRYLGNSVRIPGEDADDAQRQEFRQKLLDKNLGLMEVPDPTNEEAMAAIYDTLGRPKEASAYDKPEVEGVNIDSERFGKLAAAAHKAGISNNQFKSVVSEILSADAEMVGAGTQAREAGLAELRGEWGNAYDSKLAKAAKVAELTGAPAGLVAALGEGNTDAATLKWLDKLGSSLGGEAAELVSQMNGGDGKLTKLEAREKADEILKTMDNIPQGDPRYQQLMEKRLKYMEQAST